MMELLISWCVTSSILLAVFLLLRGTLFRKLSPGVRYALWGVVLLRLLVPFQMPDLSLPAAAVDLAPEPPILSSRPLAPDTAAGHGVIPSDQLEVEDQADLPHSASTIESNLSEYYHFGDPTLSDGVQVVWATGAGVVLLAVLAANLRFAQKLRRSRRPLPTAGCPLPVYEADGLPSPCLCGVLRPAVYLTPEAAVDGQVRTHVLAHELTHYCHQDHIWSLLRCLALALHWYNPLVWAAAVLSKRDGELSCDEGTIRRLGEGERLPYGRTLIGLVALQSGAGGVLSCSTTMTGRKKTVQRRIAQLVKQPETKKTALFLAAAALALAAVFVFAGDSAARRQVPAAAIPASEGVDQPEQTSGFSPEGLLFSSSGDNFDQVAQDFGAALAQAYRELPVGDPGAVAFAQANTWEITQRISGDDSRFCLRLSLIVQPLAPNTVYWMAGAGLDLTEDGRWRHTMEYRLEKREDGSWQCAEAASGGLNLD